MYRELAIDIGAQNRRLDAARNGRPLYIFDLDGTLADISHRRHFVERTSKDWEAFFAACVDDKPNTAAIRVLETLRDSGAEIWVFSGRSDRVWAETVAWLSLYAGFAGAEIGTPWLLMRPEGDRTPDHMLKKQWLDAMLPEDRARLVAVFDDRDSVVQMWRENGISCFQVAPGGF